MKELDALLDGPRPKAEDIRDAVCRAFCVSVDDMKRIDGSHEEQREVHWCRSLISFIAVRCGYSTREIADRCLGGRTELLAPKSFQDSLKRDPEARRSVAAALTSIRQKAIARSGVPA